MNTTEANPPIQALAAVAPAKCQAPASSETEEQVSRAPLALAPAAQQAQSADTEAYTCYAEEAVRKQLKEFESKYFKLDYARCQLGFKHFNTIVEQIDKQFSETRDQAGSQLSGLQVETIRAMNYCRSMREKIDLYLKMQGERGPKLENIAYRILNSSINTGQDLALTSALDGHPQLMALLKEHELASNLADKNLADFTRLQEKLITLGNLRSTVRLLISQTYARLGQLDRAAKLKKEVTLLGCPGNIERDNSPRGDISFNQRYNELIEFKEIFGHCDVPKRYRANRPLAAWVSNIRSRRKRGSLSQEKIDILDKIGFCWTSTRSQWETRIADLAEYIKENGHSFVPQFYSRNPYLGVWVRNLRKECRRNAISKERIEQLTAIGFNFEVLDHRWSEKLEQLTQFKERTGHCRVPHYWPENPSLARWVNIQREQKRKNQIGEERLAMLNALGFDWEPPRGRPPKKNADGDLAVIDCQASSKDFSAADSTFGSTGSNCSELSGRTRLEQPGQAVADDKPSQMYPQYRFAEAVDY